MKIEQAANQGAEGSVDLRAGPEVSKFRRWCRNNALQKVFFLGSVPMLLLAGVKISHLDSRSGATTVPYRWLNRNPFNSMYFAVQSMAAELSTAVLCIPALKAAPVPVASLILDVQADFVKKATAMTTFTCEDGEAAIAAVEHAIQTGEPTTFKARAVGTMPDGTVVSRFVFTWSFRVRGGAPA